MLKNMTKTGEPIADSKLVEAEKYFGRPLPASYKEFLLRFNGGVPIESYIDFEGKKLKLQGDEIKRFYGMGGKPTNDLIHKMDSIGDNIPKGITFIANTHGGNFFLLSLREDSYGEVFYKDHEYEDQSLFDPENNLLPESIVKVADGFVDFLSRLYEADD